LLRRAAVTAMKSYEDHPDYKRRMQPREAHGRAIPGAQQPAALR
jgi:hypothetical protein